MKRAIPILLLIALALAAQRARRKGGADQGYFHTAVPEHLFTLTLGRPTATSVTATVLANEDLEGFFDPGGNKSAHSRFPKGQPVPVLFGGLKPDSGYRYRFHYRRPGHGTFEASPVYSFHTQRSRDAAFTFAVQADSHLDENTAPETYRRTLLAMLDARPDFLIDLGDTFMTDKRRTDFREAFPQYLAQRYWFGLVAHSVPLFLTLGNHDGEGGARHDGSAESMAAWSHALRTRYFPNPRPDGFYSGNREAGPLKSPLENYYAWQWGGALFVVLDPFWPTTGRTRGNLWRWTLGRQQYDWLHHSLEQSDARFKFVFIHHPAGANTEPIRGGIAAARFGEWGGRNADGGDGFREHRPGWPMPVHALFVKHGVSVVFHGHDHLYAREELDGVVYQAVPQPGNPRSGGPPRNAHEYGYTQGTILGGSGFVRVSVAPGRASAEFVHQSDGVAHRYAIEPGPGALNRPAP